MSTNSDPTCSFPVFCHMFVKALSLCLPAPTTSEAAGTSFCRVPCSSRSPCSCPEAGSISSALWLGWGGSGGGGCSSPRAGTSRMTLLPLVASRTRWSPTRDNVHNDDASDVLFAAVITTSDVKTRMFCFSSTQQLCGCLKTNDLLIH